MIDDGQETTDGVILGTIARDRGLLWNIAQGCEQLNKLNKNLFSSLHCATDRHKIAALLNVLRVWFFNIWTEIDVLKSWRHINGKLQSLLNLYGLYSDILGPFNFSNKWLNKLTCLMAWYIQNSYYVEHKVNKTYFAKLDST